MITQETYTALRPALLLMLDLGPEAEGMRLAQLLSLYPERLALALNEHLRGYDGDQQAVQEVASAASAHFNAAAAALVTPEGADVREALKVALGHIYGELPSTPELQARFLMVLNTLRGAQRFGLLIIALCAFLPKVMDPANITPEHARVLDELLQTNAQNALALLRAGSPS